MSGYESFLIDTGLGEVAIIDARFMPQLGIEKTSSGVRKVEPNSLTGGKETQYKCSLARMGLLKALKISVTAPEVTFKDNLICDGLVGGSFWLGRRVTIDIAHRRLMVDE